MTATQTILLDLITVHSKVLQDSQVETVPDIPKSQVEQLLNFILAIL